MVTWPLDSVIRGLNPIIRGWSTYYRGVVSSNVFAMLDTYVFQRLWGWALRRHQKKGRLWMIAHYWGQFNPERQDRWVFGHRESGLYLIKFSWTKIVRHALVKGRASKDDPSLTEYWANRSRKRKPPNSRRWVTTLAVWQKGLCPKCGLDLIEGAEFEPQDVREWVLWFTASARRLHVHHIVYRRDGGSNERSNLELITLTVTGNITPSTAARKGRAFKRACSPLEPDAGMTGTSGSEGGPAQQCAGPTRQRHRRIRSRAEVQRHRGARTSRASGRHRRPERIHPARDELRPAPRIRPRGPAGAQTLGPR